MEQFLPHMLFQYVPEKHRTLYAGKGPKLLLNRDNVVLEGRCLDSVNNYFAAIAGIDDNIDRLLRALNVKGLYENTIVVFLLIAEN